MDAVHCPRCIADGVDCPLIIGGECTHCGYSDVPFSRRLADTVFQLRFAWDSITWRLRAASYAFYPRPIVGRLLACLGIPAFISH